VRPATAQSTDARWTAYLGCWKSVGITPSTICLLPVGTAVDLVTIDSGAVVAAERLIAGERVATTQGECTGWQIAEWSTVSDRLYLQSEETCPRAIRGGNGVIALARDGALLYIQGVTVDGKTGVELQRYRSAAIDSLLPSEVKDALAGIGLDLTATARARAAAMAPLMTDDVVEASRHLDADVVEAWLVERGGSIQVDAERLVMLADAGVPPRTIDLLVALAYPNAFAIGARPGQQPPGDYPMVPPTYGSFGACDLGYGYPFGYRSYYCDGFGGAYGYPGWYPGYPYVIVYTGSGNGGGSGSGSPTHGRVLNGRGYRQGAGASADVSRRGEPRSGSVGGGSSSGGRTTPSGGSSAGSSSSSGGEQRTAKPRP
jgi:hypothetical protein